MAIVYGRRRLGKTTLLRNFAKDKLTVYYMADRGGIQSQRNAMARAMAVSLDENMLSASRFDDWYSLFEAFDRVKPQPDKLVLIIDEYQYLCQAEKAFSSIMQKWWDEHWSQQNMLLILCGSVTSMMHRETLAHSSPLYGRSDGQILLQPMPYHHVGDFCKDHTQQKLVERYALCGGVPRYLELLEPYDSFETALRDGIINSLSPMASEARNLLLEEVEVPNTCWSLMETISGGATRISEIAGKLGLPANQITRYLDILKDLYIAARETPVLENNPAKSKKGIYTVTDPFLRLWFGCIYPYESLFEFGNVEAGLKKTQPLIQNHLSFCFEELARAFLKYNMDRFDAVKIGRQWGKHYEIDAAGITRNNQLSVVGECKWSNLKVGISVLNNLEKTVTDYNLPVTDNLKYVFFSRSGFTKELMNAATARNDIHLIYNLFASRPASG